MISPQFLRSQVERLSGLAYFSTLTEPAKIELIRALDSASSEVVVVAVIDEWLATQTERPTPADIYEAVDRHNAALVQTRLVEKPECPECGGIGQRIGERLYRGNPVSCAWTCETCRGTGKADTLPTGI